MIKFFFKLVKWCVLVSAIVGVIAWFYPEKFLTVDSGAGTTADVIIVLGGGEHARPLRAAQLYREHAAPRVIVTGAGDDLINRRLLIANGVPAGAIEVEGKSTTTRENAMFTGKLLHAEKIHSAILVTSWYHARRAEATFEHYVSGVKFYSRPTYYGFGRAEWGQHDIGRHMRLEFLKLPGYWVCYGVNPL